ncbi:MAG TPA: hypothetical protein ENN29_03540 [Candidatus Hydrogenedentes bacterium]|nr:hypothetical protein [Candidatus Hydrogenedentota bacterium]
MEMPEQCGACRHVYYEENEARCGKRMVQCCERDGELQELSMKPGYCLLLNPDNNCADYAKPRLRG